MKEYIVINLLNNTIVFDFRTIIDEEKVFVNKNSFYKDSLFYTLKYYKRHHNSIAELIKKQDKEFTILKICRLVTFEFTTVLIDKMHIENLVLDFLSTLDLKDYNLFLNSEYLKNIYCYYMPKGVASKFKYKKINVYTSSIKEITGEFLVQQDAFDNDTLYYKDIIKINEYYPMLLEDLKEFLKINYNLKAIHIYVYSKELIQSIVDLVKNDESRNVVIFLHQGFDREGFIINNFDWLRDLSEKCKEDYTCEFRIIYSNSFLRNNLFKQLTFNNLKLISILCIYVCVVSLIIVKAYEYIEKVSVEQLRNDIAYNYNTDTENNDDEVIDDEEDYRDAEDINSENEITKEEIKEKYTFNSTFAAMRKINNETKAYLTVKNTEISYPVVKHSDNNYYLKYDFYKKKNVMGWVFFDYRNDGTEFDDNNIIYGHAMKNGTMFGTLKKVLTASWRKNEDNMIITLENGKGVFKFKIFSAYQVDYTTDYLAINFDSDIDKKEFIDLIRGRSSFKTDDIVGVDDKILTLSTCASGNNRRLVVHAVLMKDKVSE